MNAKREWYYSGLNSSYIIPSNIVASHAKVRPNFKTFSDNFIRSCLNTMPAGSALSSGL